MQYPMAARLFSGPNPARARTMGMSTSFNNYHTIIREK